MCIVAWSQSVRQEERYRQNTSHRHNENHAIRLGTAYAIEDYERSKKLVKIVEKEIAKIKALGHLPLPKRHEYYEGQAKKEDAKDKK